MSNVFLEMKNIHKRFPGVYALKGAQLEIKKGEVHALLGENGAGKSTLMKILGGVHTQDEGQILVEGVDCGVINPTKAAQLGIGFVHQELNLAETLTVSENVYMGRLPYKNEALGIVDYKKLHEDTDSIIKKLGIDIKPTDLIIQLPTAKKQMVEIAKAISLNAKMIIFDEPTTSLSQKDVENLFKVIKTLKKEGVSAVYISHRLKEVFDICDRATVLRDGTYIESCDLEGISQEKLINMMVGRDLTELFPKEVFEPKEYVLEVEGLSDYAGRVKNVSLKARKGEILGLAGLVGSGRTELMRLVFGADRISEGKITVNGKEVKINSPMDAINNRICLLTEDRKSQGLSLVMSVLDNITLTNLKDFVLKHKKLSNVTYDNNVYGLPLTLSIGTFYCNAKLFSDANIKIPNNYDEFLDAIRAFKSKGITPLLVGEKDTWTGMLYYDILALREGGIGGTNDPHKGSNKGDAILKAAYKLKELIDLKAFNESSMELTRDESEMLFKQGEIPMYYTGNWFIGELENTEPSLRDNVIVKNFPIIKEGKGNDKEFLGGAVDHLMVSNNTKYKKEAVDAVKFISETVSKKYFEFGSGLPVWKYTDDKSNINKLSKELEELTEDASYSLYGDIYLGEEKGDKQKELVNKLFKGQISSEDFAKEMENIER